MWYTYILESLKNHTWYTGYTSDLRKRFKQHNSKQGGAYSSNNAPYKLIFYEAYLNKLDAVKAERYFKTGHGREILKEKLENYLKSK